jgi:pimeloyl-ACP methyl ester carboxylesterase
MIGNVFILFVIALSVIYAGVCVYAYYVSDSMVFPVPEASYEDGPDILKLETSTGEIISAYFLSVPGATDVLLYSHGNGEDIGHIRPLLDEYQKRGISVLAYDYPGYGTSTGKPSEAGVYAAAEAALLYLANEKKHAPETITLYGRSLGSGPACWLAERYAVSGLILDGAFSSTFRVMTGIKLLPFDRFDNLARLPKLECPVLIIHGKQDIVVPFSHALKNETVVKNPAKTLWIESANHNNLIETAGDRYWEVVLGFIQQ